MRVETERIELGRRSVLLESDHKVSPREGERVLHTF